MSSNNSLSYKRAARILTVACGLLFSIFSIVYLFVLQKDVVGALHYSLSQGKTHYSPLVGAIIITVVLLVFRWGINGLMGLKGPVRTLSYFPSCLLLGVLTDVDRTIFHGGNIGDKWFWLLPLLLLIYIGVVYTLRRVFRSWLNQEGSILGLINSNLAILTLLCLMTVGIGNTNVNFHHELAVEQAIRNHHYEAARMVGAKSLETTRTLAVLRAYAMSLEGTMGEHLFEYPQYYGAEGLLFAPHSQETLRLNADSLYAYLGARPHVAEKTVDFLARICRDEIGRHTALNYYMSALLLDKKLDKFVSAVDMYCFEQDTLPRYYREALVLYKRTHPGYGREVKDTLMVRLVSQAVFNMMVAVGLAPVTGQPLPLISKGGTSTLINCAYIGMILSVSRYTAKLEEQSEHDALPTMQIETDNGDESTYSEAQSAAEPTAKMLNSDAEFE